MERLKISIHGIMSFVTGKMERTLADKRLIAMENERLRYSLCFWGDKEYLQHEFIMI
jgi:hypothetical protein